MTCVLLQSSWQAREPPTYILVWLLSKYERVKELTSLLELLHTHTAYVFATKVDQARSHWFMNWPVLATNI